MSRFDVLLTILFETLAPGDIAFFDSSHVLFEGTDVDIIENRILHDAVKGQVNTVNVRFRSQVTTFVFKENTGRKRYPGPTLAAAGKEGADSKR